jgi:hypothetical protein
VELETVNVSLCRPVVVHHRVWEVDLTAGDSAAARDSIVYGATPPGFFTRKPAEALVPGGCYQVWASGRLRESGRAAIGSGGFRVLADGTVANGTGAQGRRLENEKEVDRAAVGCRRGYRRARTASDSAGVDARVWAVSDTTITCGFLRTRSPETIARAESTERLLLQAAGGLVAAVALWRLGDHLPAPLR